MLGIILRKVKIQFNCKKKKKKKKKCVWIIEYMKYGLQSFVVNNVLKFGRRCWK